MIKAALEGSVWVVTLARGDRRNALTPGMVEALLAGVRSPDPAARAMLIAGEGAVFCAGFDLRLCMDEAGTLERLLRGLSETVGALRVECELPVVIAAHGAAIAGGCALLGGADLVVSDAGAKIGYPVVPLGISPAVSAPFLRRCVGDGVARRLLLDPGLIDGREAARLGLVHECVRGPEEVLPRARAMAEELAGKPPGAIAATRAWLAEIERVGGEGERALGASLSRVESDEQKAGLRALFAQKR